MLDAILSWLKLHELAGTWADVAGLIGFAITIYAAWKAKSAAVAAKAAAERTRDSIRMFNTILDFQVVVSALEEIKRLHRQDDSWSSMPDKYALARKQLISLRESGVALSDGQLGTIQQAITNLSEMERVVERSLKGKAPPRVDKLNGLLSDDGDALLAVLEDIKKRGGGTQ